MNQSASALLVATGAHEPEEEGCEEAPTETCSAEQADEGGSSFDDVADPFGIEGGAFEDAVGASGRKSVIDRRLTIGIGARFFDTASQVSALKYEHAADWPFFDLDAYLYGAGIHRAKVEGSLRNTHDFDVDATYGMGDFFQFRLQAMSARHTTRGPLLIDIGALPGVSYNSPRFGVGSGGEIDTEFLDFTTAKIHSFWKMPGYPAHIYLDGWLMYRYSVVDDHFLGGSGFWDRLERSQDVLRNESFFYDGRITANAHLGPIEVEYEHQESALDRMSEPARYEYQTDLEAGAGVFLRNVVPQNRLRGDTIRIHSDSAGRLVLAGNFGRHTLTNIDTDQTGTTLSSNLSMTWVPSARFNLRAKFYGQMLDWSTPEFITIENFATGELLEVPSRRPIDSRRLDSEVVARYQAFREANVSGTFKRSDLRRINGASYGLPRHTIRTKARGQLRLRPDRLLDVRASYQHEWIDAPGENVDMNGWDQVDVAMTYKPTFFLSLMGSYRYALGQREALSYLIRGEEVGVGGRSTGSHAIYGSFRVATADNLTFSAMYGYSQVQTDQDLTYESLVSDTGLFVVDEAAYYRQDVHQLVGDLGWSPVSMVALGARFNYAAGQSGFYPGHPLALEPLSIGSLNTNDVRETRVDAYVRFMLEGGWQLSMFAGLRDMDFSLNVFDPLAGGRVTTVAFSVARSL